MSHEHNVTVLSVLIAPHIVFEGIIDPVSVTMAYKDKDCSEAMWIQSTAEKFYEQSEQFGITKQLQKIGVNFGTKLSALREAIVMNAKRQVETSRLEAMMTATAPLQASTA